MTYFIIGIAVLALFIVGVIIVRRRNQQNRTARRSSRLGIAPIPRDPDADPDSDPFGVSPPRRAPAPHHPRPGHATAGCDDEDEHDEHDKKKEHAHGGGHGGHHDSSLPDAIFVGIVVGAFFSGVHHGGWFVGMLVAGWVFSLGKLKGSAQAIVGLIGFVGIFDQILAQNTRLGQGYLTNFIKLIGQIAIDVLKVPFQELEGHWGTVSLIITIFTAWNLRGWLMGIDWAGLPEKFKDWVDSFGARSPKEWINQAIAIAISAIAAWFIVGYVESLLK